MRQIKFRIWDSKNKRFVYFQGIFNKLDDNLIGEIGQQFTGMKDKNGKEIYEGDILEIWDGRKLPVEFGEYFTGFERRDSHNGWYLASNKAISDIALDERYAVEEYGVTVVGNIFENSELLEK